VEQADNHKIPMKRNKIQANSLFEQTYPELYEKAAVCQCHLGLNTLYHTFISPVRTRTEEFGNEGFTLKTHQMIFFHATPEDVK